MRLGRIKAGAGGCCGHKAGSHYRTSATTPTNGMINTRTHAFPQNTHSRTHVALFRSSIQYRRKVDCNEFCHLVDVVPSNEKSQAAGCPSTAQANGLGGCYHQVVPGMATGLTIGLNVGDYNYVERKLYVQGPTFYNDGWKISQIHDGARNSDEMAEMAKVIVECTYSLRTDSLHHIHTGPY